MNLIKILLEHKHLLLLLAILWTLLMFILCLDTSGALPAIKIKNIDKLVHFCLHFGFVWLWYFYFVCKSKNKNMLQFMIVVVLLSVGYGVFIEFLQHQCTTTRKADVLDILANFCGAAAGVFAAKQFQTTYNIKIILK